MNNKLIETDKKIHLLDARNLDYNSDIWIKIANHIRLSFIIIDKHILIFIPSAMAWEDEPDELEELSFPNGIIGNKKLANKLLKQLNFAQEASEKDCEKKENIKSKITSS